MPIEPIDIGDIGEPKPPIGDIPGNHPNPIGDPIDEPIGEPKLLQGDDDHIPNDEKGELPPDKLENGLLKPFPVKPVSLLPPKVFAQELAA